MKSLSRLLPVLLLATAILAGASYAQRGRMPSPQARADTLAKALALNDAQKAKVLAIFTAQDDSMKAVFAAHQGDRAAMREAMQAIRSDTDAKMKAVLTDDQYSAWLNRRQGLGRGRPGGGR